MNEEIRKLIKILKIIQVKKSLDYLIDKFHLAFKKLAE